MTQPDRTSGHGTTESPVLQLFVTAAAGECSEHEGHLSNDLQRLRTFSGWRISVALVSHDNETAVEQLCDAAECSFSIDPLSLNF